MERQVDISFTGLTSRDHTDHAAWLGQALPLDVSRLAEG
jgi:aromatic ring-cleaving dioxygenase